ncbi:hypothetical protein LZ017_05250 [Pelomonas sp. CA6]|uniref:hypothetical protein n=1 Tax=Pelomonas sp. CA6 TaxID=2907999 RepID=UPI001F4A727D|nr:hypothetical protein [Pelomonas sp. CA6]MCH7342785.1 hypothetical protein [Pelomonas sp. CA6]
MALLLSPRPSFWMLLRARLRGGRRAGTPPAAAPQAQPLRLEPGLSQALYLPRGSVLHLQQGQLRLQPAPQLLAETLWAPALRLHAGAVWEASQRGWVLMQAGDAGAVVAVRR